MRGPWRQLNGPWRVHRSRGCPFARRLAAPTTASLACLASPTCERYREIQGVNCGRTALSTYCDRWLVLLVFAALIDWRIVRRLARVSQNVNACRRLASLLVIHRSRSGVRHPASRLIGIHASVRSVDVPPSMATHRLRSRRPVSARSLRCGLRSSQSLLTAPSLRSVATTRRTRRRPRCACLP